MVFEVIFWPSMSFQACIWSPGFLRNTGVVVHGGPLKVKNGARDGTKTTSHLDISWHLFVKECLQVGSFNPSEKHISQLGWWFHIYIYIWKNVPNHQSWYLWHWEVGNPTSLSSPCIMRALPCLPLDFPSAFAQVQLPQSAGIHHLTRSEAQHLPENPDVSKSKSMITTGVIGFSERIHIYIYMYVCVCVYQNPVNFFVTWSASEILIKKTTMGDRTLCCAAASLDLLPACHAMIVTCWWWTLKPNGRWYFLRGVQGNLPTITSGKPRGKIFLMASSAANSSWTWLEILIFLVHRYMAWHPAWPSRRRCWCSLVGGLNPSEKY